MKKLLVAFIWIIISFSIISGASGTEILMSYFTTTGVINTNLYYGSSEWSKMTTAVEDGGKNVVTFVRKFDDLNLMLNYDALWLQRRDIYNPGSPIYDLGGSLSQLEINNIQAFMNTGRRVILMGEWGGWSYDATIGWQSWDNQILSIVGGSYNSSFGDVPFAIDPISIGNNSLTNNVNSLGMIGNRYGTANGGLALFDPNVATLWGLNSNVLTVLDTGIFSDYFWDRGDNSIFSTNVAKWITTVPEPTTMLLLGLGLVGLAGIRRKLEGKK